MKTVAMQTSHTFTETVSTVHCVTEIVIIIIITITCYYDIKIISTKIQITTNLSSITSNAIWRRSV